MGTGNSNFVQLYLGEGISEAYFSSLNPTYFAGVTFLNSDYFINLQLGWFESNFNIRKHSANTSSSFYTSRYYMQSLETKVVFGILPIQFGKRFQFTPQFSLGINYSMKGIELTSTYNPGLATPNNNNFVYSSNKIKGGGLNLMAGLQSNYQLTEYISIFMTNEFGFATLKGVAPVTFYNSLGVSYNLSQK